MLLVLHVSAIHLLTVPPKLLCQSAALLAEAHIIVCLRLIEVCAMLGHAKSGGHGPWHEDLAVHPSHSRGRPRRLHLGFFPLFS